MFIRRIVVEMAADDAIGDEVGEGGGVVAAVFDVVQRLVADREALLVLARTTR